MKILKIAVTGSAGSGKSLVCRRLGQIGVKTLDCDKIARQVVEPGTQGFNEVVELFGRSIIQEQGTLDRARLRNKIVRDPKMRKQMEDILHPRIMKEMLVQMETAVYPDKQAVAVEVPLLFETGMDRLFDVTIMVMADDHDLVRRISKRDTVSQTDAQKMLGLQMSQQEKSQRADHVIANRGTLPELFDSVDDLFDRIQKEFLTT